LRSLQLFGSAAILIALALTGCGESDQLAEEEAEEAYLQERLAREQPSQAPHEVAVLCREASPNRLSCGASVGAATKAVSPPRWHVRLDRSERVPTAQPVGAPEPPKPNLPVRRRREVVRLSFPPPRRMRVCVNTALGRRLFGATRNATAPVKGAQVRLRIVRRSAVLSVRGRPSVAETRPHGVEIQPGRLRPLRPHDRRCR
jgi:hypothetical protein